MFSISNEQIAQMRKNLYETRKNAIMFARVVVPLEQLGIALTVLSKNLKNTSVFVYTGFIFDEISHP
jgi:hypothetical protein